MFKVKFEGFEGGDKEFEGLGGDILLRVAEANGLKLKKDCEDGLCGSCAVKIEENTEEPITYIMEEKEIETLVSMGALAKADIENLQQQTISHSVRLACQYLVKGNITVRPY